MLVLFLITTINDSLTLKSSTLFNFKRSYLVSLWNLFQVNMFSDE